MRCTVCIFLIAFAAFAPPAGGEVALDGPLELAARDDALASLFRRAWEIPLQDGRPLGAVLHGLPEEDVRIRRMIVLRIRPKSVRRYSDGSVDVDIAIEARDLLMAIDQVRQVSPALRHRLPEAPGLRVPGDLIYGTGLAFPAPIPMHIGTPAPPGWRHLSAETRRATIDAAKQRALTNLFDDLRRIRIPARRDRTNDDRTNHDRNVADLLRLAPDRIDVFRAALAEEADYEIELDPAQICVAHCDVPAQVAAAFLAPAVNRSDFPRETLSATGYAVPPQPAATPPALLPDWYHRTLTAVGKTTPQPDQPGTRRIAAFNADFALAAELDALIWPDGESVRNRLLTVHPPHEHIFVDDLATYFAGTRTLHVTQTPSEFSITVEIPLRRLYHLLAGRP